MVLTGKDVKKLFLAGAHALNGQKDYINELNVFPVPDGDTGTNMTMTIISSCRELLSAEEDTMEAVCRAISQGALKGARGNSGVILSQLFRGFVKAVRELPEISTEDLQRGFLRAVDSAYKAVMKPKEGTILTVAKGMSDKAQELSSELSCEEFLSEVVATGNEVLKKTPEMLPVLKQAGVVDSGGQGLMVFMEGVLSAMRGGEVSMTVPLLSGAQEAQKTVDVSDIETADIKFGYCTEFIIKLKKEFTERDEREFKAFLESIGDSIVCVADDGIVKIHVHTNDPGLAITRALSYGELSRMKIDNMREEHEERLFKNAEQAAKPEKKEKTDVYSEDTAKDFGFIGVSSGEGLGEILKSLEFDEIIGGGQTMNPSTEDFLEAICRVNAKTVFLFPNNGNIIMAANQAKLMTENREVIVIPSKTVPQCITAKINFNPDGTGEENEALMNEALSKVQTVEVTYAVRDTTIDGTEIHTGDYMAISGKHILSAGKDLDTCVAQALSKATEEAGSDAFVTFYYGADLQEEEAARMAESLGDALHGADYDIQYGGQPVYFYLISIETM